jgi:translation elongation factor EF-Tu-like GTPase
MVVDDVFVIRRRGTVATGRVESGQVSVGDSVRVNEGESYAVAAIEVFRKSIDTAGAGETIGLLFRDADGGQVRKGDVLTAAAVY